MMTVCAWHGMACHSKHSPMRRDNRITSPVCGANSDALAFWQKGGGGGLYYSHAWLELS